MKLTLMKDNYILLHAIANTSRFTQVRHMKLVITYKIALHIFTIYVILYFLKYSIKVM